MYGQIPQKLLANIIFLESSELVKIISAMYELRYLDIKVKVEIFVED